MLKQKISAVNCKFFVINSKYFANIPVYYLKLLFGDDNMCLQKVRRALQIKLKEKGEGAMSATVQNCVYVYGKKYNEQKPPVLSDKKMEEIRASVEKYLVSKKRDH